MTNSRFGTKKRKTLHRGQRKFPKGFCCYGRPVCANGCAVQSSTLPCLILLRTRLLYYIDRGFLIEHPTRNPSLRTLFSDSNDVHLPRLFNVLPPIPRPGRKANEEVNFKAGGYTVTRKENIIPMYSTSMKSTNRRSLYNRVILSN